MGGHRTKQRGGRRPVFSMFTDGPIEVTMILIRFAFLGRRVEARRRSSTWNLHKLLKLVVGSNHGRSRCRMNLTPSGIRTEATTCRSLSGSSQGRAPPSTAKQQKKAPRGSAMTQRGKWIPLRGNGSRPRRCTSKRITLPPRPTVNSSSKRHPPQVPWWHVMSIRHPHTSKPTSLARIATARRARSSK